MVEEVTRNILVGMYLKQVPWVNSTFEVMLIVYVNIAEDGYENSPRVQYPRV